MIVQGNQADFEGN